MKLARLLLLLLVALTGLWLAGCRTQAPPNRSGLRAVTPVPTLDIYNVTALCEAVSIYWGADWPQTIRVLEALEKLGQPCHSQFMIQSRLYFAHVAYGNLLQQSGQRDEAATAYLQALAYDFSGREAVTGLRSLELFTPQPPPQCEPQIVSEAFTALSQYVPTSGEFITIQGPSFLLGDAPFVVHGVNYYPRDYPGQRFLNLMDVNQITLEFDLMRASGLNTLRIFLRHDDLFICPGNGAVPIAENFARLDRFIQVAAEHGFRLILVLNHAPDLTVFPLYEAPSHTMQQMRFIAERYRDEPAVMAYDLRDKGDADYRDNDRHELALSREVVLRWLAQAVTLIREAAPQQWITAGWERDSSVTIPLVDFVSFQHYSDIDSLRQEIAVLTDLTQKPILLAAVGYNSLDMGEIVQRQAYQRAFEAASRTGLAGWVVWAAFDHPAAVLCVDPECPEAQSAENHYGLWSASYYPKPAIEAVEDAVGLSTDHS